MLLSLFLIVCSFVISIFASCRRCLHSLFLLHFPFFCVYLVVLIHRDSLLGRKVDVLYCLAPQADLVKNRVTHGESNDVGDYYQVGTAVWPREFSTCLIVEFPRYNTQDHTVVLTSSNKNALSFVRRGFAVL